MHLLIDHRTEYRFSEPQSRVIQLLRLTPLSHDGQTVIDWRIDVGCDARLKPGRDGFGNETTMLYVNGPLDRLTISVEGEVLTSDRAGVVRGTVEPLPPLLFLQQTPLTAASDAVIAFTQAAVAGSPTSLDSVHRLNAALFDRMDVLQPRSEHKPTAAEAFEAGAGTSRDLAHIFIAAARSFGMPARFISGYRYGQEAHAPHVSGHFWAEAYVEDFGWIGFDPACQVCPNEDYVRVSVGRDYDDAAPISGSRVGGGIEELDVGLRIDLSQVHGQG